VGATETATASRRVGLLTPAPSPVLVLGAIASVQFGAAIATTLFARVGPGGAVWLRLLFGTVILVPLWRPRLRGYARRELVLAGVFGLVLAGMNFSFYSALERIPLGVAVTIEFVGPLAVAIVGSRRPLDLVWVALAVLGILALTRGGVHHLNGLGVAFALLAGALWASYILLNARLGRTFEGATGLSLAMCVAALVMIPVGVADGGSHLIEPHVLLLGAAIGLLSSAIPYSFENEALRRIDPAVFGVLMSIEPAMGALAGFLVLGQGLGARAMVGIALVVVASVGAALRTREASIAV
jgi:inner membrane transporter RhtA